jgi:hypothetical protein
MAYAPLENPRLINSICLFICFLYGQVSFQCEWKNFTVAGSDADRVLAESLLAQIKVVEETYQRFFGFRLEQPVLIQIAESESAYKAMAGRTVPDWSGAIAFRKERKIIIKREIPFNALYYNEILRHEMAHLYLRETYLPLWLEEGVAMYLSGKKLSWWEHIKMGNSVASGNIILLSDINDLLSFGYLKAQLAYLESLNAVYYVIEQYGIEGIQALIKAAAVHQDSDLLFQKALNMSLASFETGFIKFLESKYRYMFILQFEYVLLFLMVLLVFFAYMRMRVRNRKIMHAWEEE